MRDYKCVCNLIAYILLSLISEIISSSSSKGTKPGKNLPSIINRGVPEKPIRLASAFDFAIWFITNSLSMSFFKLEISIFKFFAISKILGMNPEKAARFSFLLFIPAILGATLLKVQDIDETISEVGPASLFLGDSGAQTLGFLLASIAILYNPKTGIQSSTWFVPIMLFYVPLFDLLLDFATVSPREFAKSLFIYI